MNRARAVAAGVFAAAMLGASLRAQTPVPAVINVHVVDSTGAPVPDADLVVIRGRQEAVMFHPSDSLGKFTFGIDPSNDDFHLIVRKVGYGQVTRPFTVPNSSTISFEIVLARLAQALAPIQVDARSLSNNYTLDASEIAASSRAMYSGYDALRMLRPNMLGDGARDCGHVKNVWINGERVVFTAGVERNAGRGNGLRRMRLPSARPNPNPNGADSVLASIRPQHIEQMRYMNCWDNLIPGNGGQDAVFVTLKPGVEFDLKRGSYMIDSTRMRMLLDSARKDSVRKDSIKKGPPPQ